MPRRGKCANYAGCLLAYRNETITITEGDFVCPECKQPLTPVVEGGAPKRNLLPIIGGAVGLVVIALIAWGVWSTGNRLQQTAPIPPEIPPTTVPAVEAPAGISSARPTPVPAPEGAVAATEAASPAATAAETPMETPAATPPPAPEPEPAPAQPRAVQPNLDLGREENRTVKIEVLKRIDLMPNISPENKDKLYVSVERARQMGRIITIPFASGETNLGPKEVATLQGEVQSPQLQKLVEDPTAVFVILGFADTKGDEKINLRVSQERADNVRRTLRDKCGVMNVMHSVAMGGSTLFDESGTEKNRVAEVWAVLP